MPQLYVALPWPDYQEYMGEDWFLDESFYDTDKDVRLIPKERYDASI